MPERNNKSKKNKYSGQRPHPCCRSMPVLSCQPAAPSFPLQCLRLWLRKGMCVCHKGIFLPVLLAWGEVCKETLVGTVSWCSSKLEPHRAMWTMWAEWQFLCHCICMLEHASVVKIPRRRDQRREALWERERSSRQEVWMSSRKQTNI